MIWCDGNCHHSIVSEVEEGEEGDEEEPEELCQCPLEACQSIHNHCVVSSLNKNIWYFSHHLQKNQPKILKFVSEKYFRILKFIIHGKYLCNGIWKSMVHSSCSFSVEHGSFSGDNWLYCHAVVYSNKHD